MLFFNSCKKCRTGTVELRLGVDGYEFKCLNCGNQVPYVPVELRAPGKPSNIA